ncbi:hypothetical protein DPSP01_012624 [Paraphaeosphaeria sporulosa]
MASSDQPPGVRRRAMSPPSRDGTSATEKLQSISSTTELPNDKIEILPDISRIPETPSQSPPDLECQTADTTATPGPHKPPLTGPPYVRTRAWSFRPFRVCCRKWILSLFAALSASILAHYYLGTCCGISAMSQAVPTHTEAVDTTNQWVPYNCPDGSKTSCKMPPLFRELMEHQASSTDLAQSINAAATSPNKPKYIQYDQRSIEYFIHQNTLAAAKIANAMLKLQKDVQEMQSTVAQSFSTSLSTLFESPHCGLDIAEAFVTNATATWTYFYKHIQSDVRRLQKALDDHVVNLSHIMIHARYVWQCDDIWQKRGKRRFIGIASYSKTWDCEHLAPSELLSMIDTMLKDAACDMEMLAQYEQLMEKVGPALKERLRKILAVRDQSIEATIEGLDATITGFDAEREICEAGEMLVPGLDINAKDVCGAK